tara:strand:- start:696 stop:806 length:111 start_codon:yes stop_codon:yes gene_type:complete
MQPESTTEPDIPPGSARIAGARRRMKDNVTTTFLER